MFEDVQLVLIFGETARVMSNTWTQAAVNAAPKYPMKSILLSLVFLAVVGNEASAAPRPNVVIFLAADAGWGD